MSLDSNRQIKKGAALSYFVLFFNIVCGLLYTPWMIRMIGSDNYGLYVLVTTFLHYFVVDFGIWQAVTKILSRKRAEGDEEGVRRVLGITTKLYMVLDCVIILLLLLVYPNIEHIFSNLEPSQVSSFKIVYCIAAGFSVLSFPFGFLTGVFVSHEFFIQTKIFDLLVKVLIIVSTVIALSLGGGLYVLVFCYGFFPFVINVSRAVFLWVKGVRVDLKAHSKSVLKELFTVSWWLLVVVFAELFINNISPTILAARSTLRQVSVFGIGMTIYNYFYTFASSLNGLFVPKVTDYKINGSDSQVHALTNKVGRIQGIVLGAVLGGFIASGCDFIQLWVGSDFSQSYYVAIAIMCPQLIAAMMHIETVNLLVSDKLKYRSISMLLTAVLSVSMSYILTPTLGAVGAAIAIGVANSVFMVVLMSYYYRRYLKFNVVSFIFAVLPILIVVLVSSIAVLFLGHLLVLDSILLTFALKILAFVFLYCILIFLVANQNEKDLLYKLLSRAGIKIALCK